MSKRPCPFSDCRPQMKVHVSRKEIANGVLKDELMRDVYDKTRNLLYQGARNAVTLTPSAEFPLELNHDVKHNGSCTNILKPYPLKQMTLNQQCQLQPSTFSLEDQPSVVSCTKCKAVRYQDILSCAFCDHTVCINCIVMCSKCHELFCGNCTFDVYDSGESHICRNCC